MKEKWRRKEQEIKMPLDGAGNPEAKKCEVSLTAPYFTLAIFFLQTTLPGIGSPVIRQVMFPILRICLIQQNQTNSFPFHQRQFNCDMSAFTQYASDAAFPA